MIFLIKFVIFGWSLKLGFEIVVLFIVGFILLMWFVELIIEEGLGNGLFLIIFINIIGGILNNFRLF